MPHLNIGDKVNIPARHHFMKELDGRTRSDTSDGYDNMTITETREYEGRWWCKMKNLGPWYQMDGLTLVSEAPKLTSEPSFERGDRVAVKTGCLMGMDPKTADTTSVGHYSAYIEKSKYVNGWWWYTLRETDIYYREDGISLFDKKVKENNTPEPKFKIGDRIDISTSCYIIDEPNNSVNLINQPISSGWTKRVVKGFKYYSTGYWYSILESGIWYHESGITLVEDKSSAPSVTDNSHVFSMSLAAVAQIPHINEVKVSVDKSIKQLEEAVYQPFTKSKKKKQLLTFKQSL